MICIDGHKLEFLTLDTRFYHEGPQTSEIQCLQASFSPKELQAFAYAKMGNRVQYTGGDSDVSESCFVASLFYFLNSPVRVASSHRDYGAMNMALEPYKPSWTNEFTPMVLTFSPAWERAGAPLC